MALLLAVPLLGLAPSLMSPAVAGDTFYEVVRELDSRIDVSGFTCAGDPGTAPTAHIGLSDIRVHGQGSMMLRSAPDTLAAPMLVDQKKPSKVGWYAWPTTGTDPQGVWRIEMNDDVLTSDPIALTPGSWNRLWLPDATLHTGDWSGTISQYISDFGKGEHWRIGFLTGGCLDSPDVRLDSIGTRLDTFDFEARTWVGLRVVDAEGSQWRSLEYGDPFHVVARANRWDSAADRGRSVAGARIVFLRRWAGTHTWKPVAHRTTDRQGRAVLDGVAERMAYWRAVWRRDPAPVPSDDAWQAANTVFSLPSVNGKRCTPDEQDDLLCEPAHVSPGRVVLTGRGRPGGSAIMHLYLYAGTFSGTPILHKQDRLDHDGRWRIAFSTGAYDELYARMYPRATSHRHFPGPIRDIPLIVG